MNVKQYELAKANREEYKQVCDALEKAKDEEKFILVARRNGASYGFDIPRIAKAIIEELKKAKKELEDEFESI